MKIYFPEYTPDAFLRRKPGASWILLIMVCFFVGLCGTYFLGNHFISPAIIGLGICGILVSVAVIALRNRIQAHTARSTPAKKNIPRIMSDWHYRPKEAVRRQALGSAETLDVVTPEQFALDNNVWFNADSPEYALHIPVRLEAGVEELNLESAVFGSRKRGFDVRPKSHRHPGRRRRMVAFSHKTSP